MDYNQFDLLSDRMKGQIIMKSGVCIAERVYKCFKIYLFQIRHYYVEVYLHLTFNVVQLVRGFEDLSELDPYLENIDPSIFRSLI
jgi:hypothetical protein